MLFKNKHEANQWFLNYQPLTEEIISFCYEYDYKDWAFGDWVLFQHIKQGEYINNDYTYTISRPILALFLDFTIWDMALVMQYVQRQRAWEWHHKVISNPELNIELKVAYMDIQTDIIQFWTDNIKVLGHWKGKPTFKELKSTLRER